jgi:hypothetical protein
MKTKKAAVKSTTSRGAKAPTGIAEAIASGEIPWRSVKAAGTRATRGASELPIGESSARKVTRWLMSHFGEKLHAAGKGTPFSPDILCAIACQETAYFWLPLLQRLETKAEFRNDPGELADLILARCVLDASGDAPGAPRSAFPKSTEAFRTKYGAEFTNLLIEEANQSRKLRGFGPKQWVYKGYGIFQYDLQFVASDEAFFRERKWYDFDACLAKCIGELKAKYKAVGNDLWEAVRAYNGSGPRARAYRDNVKQFAGWTRDEIAKLPAPATPPATRSTRARGTVLPSSRPRLTQADLASKLAPFNLDRGKHPLVVVGIRGYYMDTMGQPGVNDRGIYDDAIFIDSADGFASYNGNTDPSKFRPGSGFNDRTKGIAKLKAGVWLAHKLDYHGSRVHGPYRAICQRLGKVTVIRDGTPPYEDTGNFGINIHKGGYQGTSSEGCQTLHPDQWDSFINLAMDLAKRYFGIKWESTVIPYVLIEA